MSKKIKIAIYSGIVPSTTFIERLTQGLAANGNQIYLFGLQQDKYKRQSNCRYITHTNALSKLLIVLKYTLLLLLRSPKDKKKLDKFIAKSGNRGLLLKLKYYPVLYHRPAIFHLQWAKSIEDWIWVQEFGIKLILSLRGAHINYSPLTDPELAKMYKTLFPKIDGFHAVSKAIALEATKYGAALNRTRVIYSGLDLEHIPFHLKNFDANKPIKIISIGRAHWKKGYSYALNTMAGLKAAGVAYKYTIVGVGFHEELMYQRSQLGLEHEVLFLEKMTFKEVLHSINAADVLLLSSVEEGIANVVLEAMAMGTVVVSSQCGGMEEVVINGENGFLVPIRDSSAMTSALIKISSLNAASYQEITLAARRTIEKQHSHTTMIDEMENLYQNVLNKTV